MIFSALKFSSAIKVITTSLLLSLSISTQADSSVWEISNGDNTLYLGGTFHLLKHSDYPLPEEFEHAYQNVNWLVFETDVRSTGSPEKQQRFREMMQLPTGKTLKDVLAPDTYEQLSAYCQRESIALTHYQSLKPQMISLVIAMHELQQLGLTAPGVETHFDQKAQTDKKIVN